MAVPPAARRSATQRHGDAETATVTHLRSRDLTPPLRDPTTIPSFIRLLDDAGGPASMFPCAIEEYCCHHSH